MTATLDIDTLYEAGAHFGYPRRRRHPSASEFLFGTRDQCDIFDLAKTGDRLDAACIYVAGLAQKGAQILFVSGKNESQEIIRRAAERAGVPFVAGRWIGGTITNFKNIKKRIASPRKMTAERESGELEKYTKKERLLIDREIEKLQNHFGGLTSMHELPAALFVIDTRHEDTAVKEANQVGIPVIGLSSSDCDFSLVQYPIPANDTSIRSVQIFTDAVVEAYLRGKKSAVAPALRA